MAREDWPRRTGKRGLVEEDWQERTGKRGLARTDKGQGRRTEAEERNTDKRTEGRTEEQKIQIV